MIVLAWLLEQMAVSHLEKLILQRFAVILRSLANHRTRYCNVPVADSSRAMPKCVD